MGTHVCAFIPTNHPGLVVLFSFSFSSLDSLISTA